MAAKVPHSEPRRIKSTNFRRGVEQIIRGTDPVSVGNESQTIVTRGERYREVLVGLNG
jgi:hypothetical protein